MFFVRGLSFNGKDVFVNPDQVLYVCATGLLRRRTALVMTHGKRLIVDQDTETVRQRFEDYLDDVIDTGGDADPDAEEGYLQGQRFGPT
jgi:uncharacterized protein YlzI (FlbEa/FlbD family)